MKQQNNFITDRESNIHWRKSLSFILALVLLIGCITIAPQDSRHVQASSTKVNLTASYLGSQSKSSISKYKNILKISGVTKKKSSSYPAFYASGNKIKVGVNYKPSAAKKQSYVYYKNTGNKSLGILGVYVGTKTTTAIDKLNSYGFDVYKTISGAMYLNYGQHKILKLSVASGKVTGFIYKFKA